MADERVVAELVASGAQKFIQDFTNSANAVTNLQTKLEATNRIRTAQLGGDLDRIRATIDQLGKDGVQGVNELNVAFEKLATRIQSVTRIRTTQLSEDIKSINKSLEDALKKTITGEAGAARNRSQLVNVQKTLDPSIQLRQQQMVALAAAERQATVAAEAHARTLQGQLHNALRTVSHAIQEQIRIRHQATQVTTQNTQATQENANAQGQLINASSRSTTQGITYLSTLSAIHAASFLATGSTFSMIGSFFTLGAAFTKLGPGAAAVGLAFGGLLAIFGAISNGIQILQQALTTFTITLVKVASLAATAVTAAGAASVKIAADVEQALGLIQAIERPTRERLGALEEQITQLSQKFGIAAKDVTEAASLFVRAGGSIEQALAGALEAVIQLQIASAGELTAATAARTIAVGLQAFSKEGATAVSVANAITRAAQGSALSFTEVNQAFQQAVPGAVTLGITLGELAAVIAVLGNNALRGTVAGTAFKQFLLDLVNPSSSAAKTMAELGINIADADQKIRPLRDILTDLSAKLRDYEAVGGAAADATKAQAIANIFGSRSALAANIIIRESVEALDDFNEKTREVTAANVAATLLLPLNAQFRILQNNLREAGRAFGAPLLAPIAAATTAAGKFVADLIPIAKLAGQAIAVILSGQGFGALRDEISKLADSRATAFFIEFINVGRNVRDVIVNQIIPAIQDFITTLTGVANEDGRLEQAIKGFNTINKAIQVAGAVAATAIRNFALLVTEFINGTGEGGKLKDILDTIATKILVTFVSNTVALVASLAGAILVLNLFVEASLAAARGVLNVVAGVDELRQRLDQLQPRLKLQRQIVDERDPEKLKELRVQLAELDRQLESTPEARSGIRSLLQEIDKFAAERNKLQGQMDRLGQDIQATNTKIVASFQDMGGSLPDILSNITRSIEDAQVEQDKVRQGGTQGGPIGGVDAKEVVRVTTQIEEAGRDIARKLEGLATDTTTRIQNIVDKALERIGDINEKLQRDLAKLTRDTKEKIDDLNEQVTQRRSDRSLLDNERRQQERRLQVIERSLEKQALFEERQLEQTRILRQRSVEDVQRSYDLQADAVERSYARQQSAAEQAFQAQQKIQQQALELTQSAEEKALSRQLDNESRTRDEGRQRSEAKTPEDRKRVEEQIARARQDKAFESRQQSQLDQLKARHDSQRTQLSERQEQAARQFSLGQEDAALVERLRREAQALRFRRTLEEQERTIRLSEEDSALERRRNNEIVLDTIKRTQATEFQKFQDGLEDAANKRREAEFERDRVKREQELTDTANVSRGEVLDQVTQQLAEVNQTIDREIRTALDRLKDIEDSLTPDVAAAVKGVLLGVQSAALSRSQDLLRNVTTQTQQAGATVGAQLEVTQPTQVQSLVANTLTVTALHLPQGFVTGISQGMLAALIQADRLGVFEAGQINLQPLIDELRSPSPLPTRR